MLLAIDFDGTLTDHDTLDLICQTWAPDAWREAEEELTSGRWTLEQVIEHEFAAVAASREEVLALVHERVALRPGLPALLETCVQRFVEPVVVSSGFTHADPARAARPRHRPADRRPRRRLHPGGRHGDLPRPRGLRDAAASAASATRCCGAPTGARWRTSATAGPTAARRCAADLVFARAGLARYLDDERVPYLPFEDFHDVREGLVAYLDGR